MFPENIGPDLSIDEVAVQNGELYTVLTNKDRHGKKGALVAIAKGTKVEDVVKALKHIPTHIRDTVRTITRDLAESMEQIASQSFTNAEHIEDRFHVQQLVSEALQEIRVAVRKEAIKEHNAHVKAARERGGHYWSPRFENGDTKKELLARSRHLLFKPSGKWTDSQRRRSEILFREFPDMKSAYTLSMMFRGVYEQSKTNREAQEKLHRWYEKVEESIETFPTFETPMQTIKLHEKTILNYFERRLTNASAESFNAKIKNFRALQRGVRDVTFFLYRLTMIYA